MRKRLWAFVSVNLIFTACTSLPDRHPDSIAPSVTDDLSHYLQQYGAKRAIVKPGKGVLKYDYIVPAGPYDQLFDWDMYFMGVALSYDHVGKPVSTSVEDFLLFVDEYANSPGYAPREIATTGPWALPQQCKPFIAQAAVRASLTMGSYQWLKDAEYKKLKLMLEFWEKNRKATDGLFVWDNGLESGADNTPAVSVDPTLTTEGVDLQVYLYREYLAVALLAQKLNHPKDEAHFRAKAERLRETMLKRMWSEKEGMFFNINSRSGKKIPVKAWSSFTPLWAKMVSPEQAKRMIETHLLNPSEFWAEHGVRTLTPDHKLYDPNGGYWRGPVWVISNYLLMHGLINYGYQKEAITLAEKTVNLLVKDYQKSKGMNECYNPETGEPTASGDFVSWNLLAEHMLEEARTRKDPTDF